MSKTELDRAGVIQRVLDKRLTQREAAPILGLTERQLRRLCRRARAQGLAGLANRARGRPNGRRLAEEVRVNALGLVRERYHDFGPTLAGVLAIMAMIVFSGERRRFQHKSDNRYYVNYFNWLHRDASGCGLGTFRHANQGQLRPQTQKSFILPIRAPLACLSP